MGGKLKQKAVLKCVDSTCTSCETELFAFSLCKVIVIDCRRCMLAVEQSSREV